MAVLTHPTDAEACWDTFVIDDDFAWYVTAHNWTSLAADTNSSVAATAAAGGVLAINTGDATDNNEAGVFTTNEVFKMAAGKPLYAKCRLQYSEINTNAANVFFGFADAPGANLIADNGGTNNLPAISNSGVCFFKYDGGSTWRVYSKNGADTDSTDTGVTAGGSSYVTLEIIGNVVDGSLDEYEFVFKVDGNYVRDTTYNRIVKHKITYTSATEMDLGVYCKAGGGSTLTVNVDRIFAKAKR